MSSVWYIARDDKVHGPISEAEFAEFLKRGHLLATDYVWHDGLDEWLLGEDLLTGLQRVPEPLPQPPSSRARFPVMGALAAALVVLVAGVAVVPALLWLLG